MRKTAPVYAHNHAFRSESPRLPVQEIDRHLSAWILDGEISGFTDRTMETRRHFVKHFRWFLADRRYTHCGEDELRALLAYLQTGHKEPRGRWGQPRLNQPLSPRSAEHWHDTLHAFYSWLVEDGIVLVNPLAWLPKVDVPEPDIQPFTPEQVDQLLKAARHTTHPRRDEALCFFLLDNGVRVSELCAIQLRDVDFQSFQCTIREGKGSKPRPVPFGRTTKKALWRYLHEGPERPPNSPLFTSDRGLTASEALTRSGVYQLFDRLGQAAGITGVRCSPHTCRHTFAIEFLRAGGGELTLMTILGHTTLTMTRRYAKIAQADVLNQHRACSPIDRRLRR